MLEHLLRDFRSSTLRRQFFSHDQQEYTDTLDVKLLVSTTDEAAAAEWHQGRFVSPGPPCLCQLSRP